MTAVAGEIRDEKQFHLQMRTEEYERQGLPADEARRAASRRFGNAAWPAFLGLSAGMAGAFYATRIVASFLFETTSHDPATFAAVAVLMGFAALVAAWIPARRAARVDPVIALRAE